MSRRVRDAIVGGVAAVALVVALGFIVRELRKWPEVEQWIEKLTPGRRAAPPTVQTAPTRPSAPASRPPARSPWEEVEQDRIGLPPLLEAVHTGQVEQVQVLLGQGEDVRQTAPGGYQAIHAACAEGRKEVVQVLLGHGADVNAAGPRGWTPLMLAAAKGDVELVRMLLGAGADPKMRNARGHNAREIAAEGGFQNVAMVLETGTGLSQASEQLLEAAGRGEFPALLKALRTGADVQARDEQGRTALHRLMEAVDQDKQAGAIYDAVWMLVEAGADINALDGQGYTPIMRAVQRQAKRFDVTLIRLLLRLGADPNRRVAETDSPTMKQVVEELAMEGQAVEAVRQVLVEGGWNGQ